MDVIGKLVERASNNPKTIVYPEGDDDRVIRAVNIARNKGILKRALLLGKEEIINSKLEALGIEDRRIQVINPLNSDKQEEFANIFFELRKHKGIDFKFAQEEVRKNLIFAGLLTRLGIADGFIGGSVNTTADTVRAAFYTLGLKKNIPTMASFFIMDVPNSDYGEKGLMLFADCAVIKDPSPKQLVNITKYTAEAMNTLFGKKAKCALLSYSTKGSGGDDPTLDKIKKSLSILSDKYPEIVVDGEMQVDAALCVDVAKLKLKESPVAGIANVLIFPDLNSGNISYKLVQRLAKARAIGPILVGLSKPANDLSRGCNVDDIVNVTAVTVLQTLQGDNDDKQTSIQDQRETR